MSNIYKISSIIVTTVAVSSFLVGCATTTKTGAKVGVGFSEKHILPPILAMGDVDMVCNSSNALAPVMMSTQSMGADPTRMAVLLYAASGVCAENNALNAELRYLRASKAGQVSEAQDARIEQKRWAAIAAERQYTGYQLFAQRWETKYKYKLGESCPKMDQGLDQTVYLLGLVSGLQSMTNDISSGGQAHIPKDIAAIVERSMTCLDNTEYWGAPQATRAVIWTLLPGSGDGKPDPYQTMKQSMQLGEQKGVRLSHALNAVAAQASGDDGKIRDALRAYAASTGEDKSVNPEFRLIDQMASQMVQNIADRYWTEHTGVRANEDGLSRFWDDQAPKGDDDWFEDAADTSVSPN